MYDASLVIAPVIGALVMLVLSVLSMVFLGIWAYRDAKARGIDTPVLWGFLVVLVPWFIGVVIYLVMRTSYPVLDRCGACGNALRQSANFCPACGAQHMAGSGESANARPMLIAFFVTLGVTVVVGIVVVALFMGGFLGLVDYALHGDYYYDYEPFYQGAYRAAARLAEGWHAV